MQIEVNDPSKQILLGLYADEIRKARNGGLDQWLSGQTVEIGGSLSRPLDCPEKIWDGLSPASRCQRRLSRIEKQVRTPTSGKESFYSSLDAQDVLRMIFPQVSEEGARIATQLIGAIPNVLNSAEVRKVIEYVLERTDAAKPLEICVSQCFKKDDQVRPGKLGYFLGQSTGLVEMQRFTRSVETLGWDELQVVFQKVEYPVRVTVLLGDMDSFTLDGCHLWCTPESLKILEQEMSAWKYRLQGEAERTFRNGQVVVRRWSELYDYRRFESELARASRLGEWTDRELIPASEQMYLRTWGYGSIARRMGLDDNAIRKFIVDDCVRTAAQYRTEANVIAELGGIQAWAERVPERKWPMRISGYDGAPVPPTLFLV